MTNTQLQQENLLKSGAYIATDTQIPNTQTTDQIDARIYHHTALPNTPIVRLTPTQLALAEDAHMDFFGFSHTLTIPKIALRKPQALGFPQAVILSDPQNAALAIEISKQLKRNIPLTKSKPGLGRKEFDRIAAEIPTSLPHFLSSYYEQVARTFIECGNAPFAAVAFGKARETETVYALDVDDEQVHQAFIEFALVDALATKVMDQHVKNLTKRIGAAQAYERFFDICVRRTLGGSSPSASTAEQLQKLAKSLKLDANTEDDRFINAVWQSPALNKAATNFWTIYSKTFARLSQSNLAMRGYLLNLFPTPTPNDTDFKSTWLKLLDDCHALDALTMPAEELTPEIAPQDSTTAWFSKLCFHSFLHNEHSREHGESEAVFKLLRQIAPRIKADGDTIDFQYPGNRVAYYNKVDIDLCDLALELGLHFKTSTFFNIEGWVERKKTNTPAAEYPRPLTFIANDPVHAVTLGASTHRDFNNTKVKTLASSHPALNLALRAWFETHFQHQSPALPGFNKNLHALTNKETLTFAALNFPDIFNRIKQLNPAAALAGTIQNGLLDEYTWPAFDQAVKHFQKQHKCQLDDIRLTRQFPYLILHRDQHALVINAEGVVVEQDIKLPAKADWVVWIFYAQKQFAVCYRDSKDDYFVYWTSNPTQMITYDEFLKTTPTTVTIELENGNILTGKNVVSPGSYPKATTKSPVSDGENFWLWTQKDEDSKPELVEFNPETNQLGRTSMPAFFENFTHPDYELLRNDLYLYPLGSPTIQSPLGSKNGVYGWRARKKMGKSPRIEIETIDGRRFETTDTRLNPTALLAFPAATTPRVFCHTETEKRVTERESWVIYTPDGRTSTLNQRYTFSLTRYVPIQFFHYFTPRDAASSARLRAFTENDAQTLLDAALISPQECTNKIAQSFPEITDPTLIDSLTTLFKFSATGQKEFQEFVAKNAPDVPETPKAPKAPKAPTTAKASKDLVLLPIDNTTAFNALGSLFEIEFWFRPEEDGPHHIEKTLTQISDFLFNDGQSVDAQIFHFPWPQILGNESLPFHLALSEHISAEDRAENANILKWMSHLGFLRYNGKMRRITATPDSVPSTSFIPATRLNSILSATYENNRYICYFVERDPHNEIRILEYAPSGEFKTPPGIMIAEEFAVPAPRFDDEQITQMLDLLATNGPVTFDKNRVQNFADQTNLSYTEACIIWPGAALIYPFSGAQSTELRDKMDLKKAQLDMGVQVIYNCSSYKKLDVLRDFIPLPQLDPWHQNQTSDPYVDQLAKSWSKIFGKSVLLPEDLILDAEASLALRLDAHRFFSVMLAPHGLLEDVYFTDSNILVSYLFTNTPVGDPTRQHLPVFFKDSTETFPSPDFQAFITRIQSTPVPTGQYETNPLFSTPEIITEIIQTLNISEDAAVLFLQTLTLAQPTTANIRLWNSWTPPRYKKATQELTDKNLFIEAKRARAGRNHFIHGPWLEQKAPHLPIETWKLPFYQDPETKTFPFNNNIIALKPTHLLFQQAWQRYQSGDKPTL